MVARFIRLLSCLACPISDAAPTRPALIAVATMYRTERLETLLYKDKNEVGGLYRCRAKTDPHPPPRVGVPPYIATKGRV